MDKLQGSEAMKKAKDAYERARVRSYPPTHHFEPDSISLSLQLFSSIEENSKLHAAAKEVQKAGVQIRDAMSEALKPMEESEIMHAVCI